MAEKLHIFKQSHSQRRLWFVQSVAPDGLAYNAMFALWMRGALDVAAMARSIAALIERHESLRTTFGVHGGEEVQRIHPTALASLAVESLESLPADSRKREAKRRCHDAARRPFDLERGPLFRPQLLRLNPEEHVLLLGLHHIIYDGSSLDLLLEDLGELYSADTEKRPPRLGALSLNYADFAQWERGAAESEALAPHLEYWKKQLGGELLPLQLPADRPRPPAATHRGDVIEFFVPSPVTDGLKELAQQERATLFMAVLSAFQALLNRISGQSDVRVGVARATRAESELNQIFGTFVNLLVIRTDFSAAQSFRELLRQVRRTSLDAYSHEEVPLESVVKGLQIERSLSRNPLYDAHFVFQPRSQPLKLGGLAVELEDVHCGGAKVDLTLTAWEEGTGLHGRLEYSLDLFERASAERIVSHFQTLLERMVRAPDDLLPRISHVGVDERARILEEAVGAATGAPERLLHELFEEQARLRPDALALVSNERSLTYRELDEEAERVASHLESLGLRVDEPVAMVLERSAEWVAATLGILKAGGCFLPVDPSYPSERIAVMLKGLPPDSIVVCASARSELPVPSKRRVNLEAAMQEKPSARSRRFISPANLAYFLFTSGSTGTPKGVMVPHAAAANLAITAREAFGAGPGNHHLQWASPSFDLSIGDLFVTLAAGGTLHLSRRESLLPGPELIRLLVERKINSLFIVPSALAVLPEADLPGLRTIIIAGEKCTPELLEKWARGRRFINGYGPTEVTIVNSLQDVATTPSAGVVGRPLPNTSMVVLDPSLELVGLGEVGELYISGRCLARGYFAHPERTAESFIPDPYGPPGSRMYRTGDMMRLRTDGCIEFVGRRDHQVKVRGHRVELGDIEAALRSHPDVRDAAAIAHQDAQRHTRLLAYVTPKSPGAELEEALRSHLGSRLPGYMVPSAFYMLERMPLNRSGKLDRNALPSPEVDSKTAAEVEPTLLPADRPRTTSPSYASECLELILPEAAGARLSLLAEECGTTRPVALLAAFEVLLSRYSGQERPRVRAGFSRADDGGFPVAVSLEGRPDFREFVRRTELSVRAALLKTIDWVQDAAPLAVSFCVEGAIRAPGRCAQRKSELVLAVQAEHGSGTAALEYVTELFDRSSMTRLADHFGRLLKNLSEHPERSVHDVDYLSAEELAALLPAHAQRPLGPQTLHALFEEQVAANPAALAVNSRSGGLTYAELNRRAEQLADALAARGLRSEELVGVALPRSTELLVAVFGILKAGGAYLPLDVNAPPERMSASLSRAKLRFVLAEEGEGRLFSNAQRLSVAQLLKEKPKAHQRAPSHPEGLACGIL